MVHSMRHGGTSVFRRERKEAIKVTLRHRMSVRPAWAIEHGGSKVLAQPLVPALGRQKQADLF